MLALLSASALAPVAVAVAGGTVVATALAGVAGGVGGGYLTGVIEKAASRLLGRNTGALRHPGGPAEPRRYAAGSLARDLGLAAQHPEPGEGPAEYQAPEQRRRSYRRPGPSADAIS